MNDAGLHPDEPLPASLLALLAVGAGLSVGGLYFNQPILGLLAAAVGATPEQIGLVPTLTQLGYALGLVLSAPLGDRFDRRRVILVKALLLAACLALQGLARSFPWLCLTSLGIGLAATVAQEFVPMAAALAPVPQRGRTVGTVMTGLLLGILLSRTVSGVASDLFGWRAVYAGAALAVVLLALVSLWRLPHVPATTQERYPVLLRSLGLLLRELPALRRAALTQGLLMLAFGAFWSTLALALQAAPFHLGSSAAGSFGLAGAAGALAAPLAGAAADRRGPALVIQLGAGLVLASFVTMALFPGSLVVIAAGALLFDLGVQASLIAHQTIVYGLDPSARSRVNAVLVSSMFVGMSTGALLGSQALARGSWASVCALGAGAALAAGVVRALPDRAAAQAGSARNGGAGSP